MADEEENELEAVLAEQDSALDAAVAAVGDVEGDDAPAETTPVEEEPAEPSDNSAALAPSTAEAVADSAVDVSDKQGNGTEVASAEAGNGGAAEEEEDAVMEFEEAEKDPTFRSLEECEAILEAARAKNRRRAERFGAKYQEPNKWALLTRTEIQRLRAKEDDLVREKIQASKGERFVRGIDPSDAEEAAKRAARAAKFGVAVPAPTEKKTGEADVPEAERLPMLTEQEKRDRETRRQRAARFGVQFEEDVAVARSAWNALKKQWTIADKKGMRPVIRKSAIHVRAAEYLCASNKDLQNLFGAYGIEWVEWLNGQCVNVLFKNAKDAERAMSDISEPIPVVQGVKRVHPQWRHCVKLLVKSKSDAYGPAGSLTKVYVRYATNRDVKELAKRTAGPRHVFGRRARKPKRPRAPRQRTDDDRKREEQQREKKAANLDSALDRYLGGAEAAAAEAPRGQGRRKKQRRSEAPASVVSTSALEAIVGAKGMEAIEKARPKTDAEKLAALDAAMDAYRQQGSAESTEVSKAAAPEETAKGAET